MQIGINREIHRITEGIRCTHDKYVVCGQILRNARYFPQLQETLTKSVHVKYRRFNRLIYFIRNSKLSPVQSIYMQLFNRLMEAKFEINYWVPFINFGQCIFAKILQSPDDCKASQQLVRDAIREVRKSDRNMFQTSILANRGEVYGIMDKVQVGNVLAALMTVRKRYGGRLTVLFSVGSLQGVLFGCRSVHMRVTGSAYDQVAEALDSHGPRLAGRLACLDTPQNRRLVSQHYATWLSTGDGVIDVVG